MTIKYFNDPEALLQLFKLLMEGTKITLVVFALTLIISIPLGLLVSVGRMSKHSLVWRPISLYILVMRGSPLMLQLMFIYFLLPQILPFKLDRFWAVIFAFSINYAAYFAEIFRGGIGAIPNGQREAAQVLGFSKGQTFFLIILPQVFKFVLLSITNEVITLVKDTSLAFTVSVAELMRMVKTEVSRTSSVEPYLLAMIIYLVLNGIATLVCQMIERRLSYYK